MNFNFLIELLSKTVATAGESKLKDILQDLHDSNIDDYQAAIQGGDAFVKHLQPLVDKSKTSIDDAVLLSIKDAIAQSAAANGVAL